MAIEKKNSYRDNPLLKKAGVQQSYTQQEWDEFIKCKKDPIYFIKKYVQIVTLDKGIQPFKMWKFQEEFVNIINKNRFVITKMPRQVGKTTTSVAYFLWFTIFNPDQSVAILANKGSLARDILAKYQLAYENLPSFLQQGVVEWNKGNVKLENGSKLIAGATSSSAIRGGSFNLVFLDEFAHVQQNMAVEFFTSVYPVITSGKDTKVIIVSTPKGMNLFYKIWSDAEARKSDYVPFQIHWSDVPGRDEKWKEETIRNTSEKQFQQEFECEFLGSSNTLISGSILQQMTFRNPKKQLEGIDIFEEVIKQKEDDDGNIIEQDHLYALTVDTAEGKELDSCAFSVIDVSKTPYVLVAKYINNEISPMVFPTVIYNAARYYNNAYVLIEIQSTGQQIANILHMDLEYENILKVTTGNKKQQQISAGHTKNAVLGVKTSPATKRIGCINLKSLIESKVLLVEDADIINELSTYVLKPNGTYSAEVGSHDDLVSTLVTFAWLTTQQYFKEMMNHDLRKRMQEQYHTFNEESMLPIMELQNGLEDETQVVNGDLWVETTMQDPYFDIMHNFRRMI